MSKDSSITREAYLTEDGTFKSFSHIINAVREYVSERNDLTYTIKMRGSGAENVQGEISVYPVKDAKNVLEITDEISNRLRMDVQFRMRLLTEKN
jgi:hypothetical protein